MISRDSLLLFFGILASILAYLATGDTPPWQWSYAQWIQALIALVGIILGWLRSSPLAASTTPNRDATTILGGMLRVYDKKE